jgi:uridine kinase
MASSEKKQPATISVTTTIEQIRQIKPLIILVCGKSTTGKTSFAKKISGELKYIHINLDMIIENLGKKANLTRQQAFGVYKGTAPKEFIEKFIETIRDLVKKNPVTPIIIDGALKLTDMINKMFETTPYFLFMIPSNPKTCFIRAQARLQKDFESNDVTLPITQELFETLKEDYVKNGIEGEIIISFLETFVKRTLTDSIGYLNPFISAGMSVQVVDIDL